MSCIQEPAQVALRLRARKLLGHEIDFISSDEFRLPEARRSILGRVGTAGSPVTTARGNKLPKDLPAHLARLCESQLLTAEEERNLFRQMNYLKYRANALRVRLDPDSPDAEMMDQMDELLCRANQVRDQIIKANMRLAIAIVKKFVTPKHSFDDLLSDGIVSLMQAVDKFDYSRGFRFSTYAYRAVARNAYRTINDQHKMESRFDTAISEDLTSLPEQDRTSPLDEQQWARMRTLLGNLLPQLDRREQFILRGRFALGAHREVLGPARESPAVSVGGTPSVGRLGASASSSPSPSVFPSAFSSFACFLRRDGLLEKTS